MTGQYVRVSTKGMLRETLVGFLARCRQGRKGAILLAREVVDGYHYALVENDDVRATLAAVLTELVVDHAVVDSLPGGKRLAPIAERKASSAGRMWTGSPKVDEAIENWLVELFTPNKSPFDS